MSKWTIIGAALAAALGAGAASAEGFEQHVAADAHGMVEISNVNGRVDVEGWDRPEVYVRAPGSSKVEVTSAPGHTSIRVVHSGPSLFGSGSVDLTVSVPKGSEVDVSAVSADVKSAHVEGAQHLHTISGNIAADFGPGDLEVKTVSGDTSLKGPDETAQARDTAEVPAVRITSVSGDVSLQHGARTLEAQSVSGDLAVQLGAVHSVRLRTTSGDLSFSGQLEHGATLESESVSGDLKLKVGGDDYAYEVSSFSGDINNCFGQEAQRVSAHGPGKRLSGTRGAGEGKVRVKSMSGDVSLCDH